MSRLLEIIYILLDKKTITAKELAEHFEVSQRTIYRDVDTLSLAGFPVYTNKGKGGGISILEDFVLNKSILSESEQNEILSALQSLSILKVDESNQVLRKLSTVFNKSTVNWLEVDFSDWSYANGDKFCLLKNGILEKRIARFDYYSSYGEKTYRKIEPTQLWFKHQAWYVKGYCLERQSMRLFKLTRIKNLVLTDEHFSERNLAFTEQNNAPENKKCKDVTLKLKIQPKMTFRVYDEFDENEISKNTDGSYTVTVTYPEDDWVYGFIMSFGEHIEVLEPTHMRKIIKEKFQKSLEKYL